MANCECGLNCKTCQFCSSPVCECYCYNDSSLGDDFDDEDDEKDLDADDDEDDYRDYYDD